MSTNNKVCILYPVGCGGNWLSTVIHALETKNYFIPKTNSNFHDNIVYPKTQSFEMIHTMQFDRECISLHGHRSNFIIYVNEYTKFLTLAPDPSKEFYKKTLPDRFFYQSNNALWRISGGAALEYSKNIKFNYDLIFTEPNKFTQQLYQVLDEYSINYTPNNDFVLEAINSYVLSCPYKKYFGVFDDTVVWAAWCHALCIHHQIDIHVDITKDYKGFIDFLRNNCQQFAELTKKNNIV